MNDAPVAVGDLVAHKYRVDRVLGVGGMGVVVAATHEVLDQRVAIKFLHPDLAQHAEAALRFQREARAAVKIHSEHVCRVLDVGVAEGGAPFMVMEYLEGCDLGQQLDDHGAFELQDTVDYVLQACEALAEAHAAGIVHRDLKPANLFLATRADGSRTIKVLDFGISKLTDNNVNLTKTSSVMGSPQYMAPEQMQSSKQVDQRTDIWALGAIVYELLAGKPPFPGETVPEICINIVNTEPEPLGQLRPSLPAGLVTVVERCLKKDPAERFDNVAELAAELSVYGSPMSQISVDRASRILHTVTLGTPVGVTHLPTRVSGPSQFEVSPTVSSYNQVPMSAPGSMSNRMLVALGAVMLLVGIGGTVVYLGRGSAESEPAAPAAEVPAPPATVAPPAEPAATATAAAAATASAAPSNAPSAEPPSAEPVAEPPAAAAPAAAAPAAPVRGPLQPKPAPKPAGGSELDITGFGDRK